jgi:hypothetical protein
MRHHASSAAAAALAGLFLSGPARAQNPLELLLQQQSHYWFAAESVFGGTHPALETADDFNVVAAIQRVRASGKSCFSCTPGDLISARLRFYEWTSSGPGALQYELHLQDGDPRLTYAPGPSLIDFTVDPPFHATGKHFVSVQVEVVGYWAWWASNYGEPQGATVHSRPDDGAPWELHDIVYPAGPAFSDLAFELYGDDGTPPSAGVDPCGPWEVYPALKPTDGNSLFLRAVESFATDDVWAVGEYNKLIAPPFSYKTFSWIQHWDGNAWSHVPSPNPEPYPGGGYVGLSAIGGVAPDDVWAAGTYRTQAPDGYLGMQIFLVHWDGSAWSQVAAPMTTGGSGQHVEHVLAIAPDDVWFFGDRVVTTTINSRQALALHWDGSGFTYHDVPFDPAVMLMGYGDGHSINFASALAPDDIWAVGQAHGPDFSPISNIWHWDGSSWQFVPGPTPGAFNALFAVAAIDGGDVWAAGAYTPSGGGANQAFYLRWDGSAWSEVPAPGGGGTLVVRGPDDILSSAGIYGGQGIFRWDGTAWSKVMNFDTAVNPMIVGLELVGGCELWGVGRQNGPDAGALLVHLDGPSLVAAATVMTPCTGLAPQNSLVASPAPKLGAHVSFAADDPAGSAGLMPGSLAFLALSATPLGAGACGLVLAGLGPGATTGELFLEPKGPVLSTAPWAGPGQAAVFDVPIPAAATLAGFTVRAQTVFVDAVGGDLVLTDAIELLLGK